MSDFGDVEMGNLFIEKRETRVGNPQRFPRIGLS